MKTRLRGALVAFCIVTAAIALELVLFPQARALATVTTRFVVNSAGYVITQANFTGSGGTAYQQVYPDVGPVYSSPVVTATTTPLVTPLPSNAPTYIWAAGVAAAGTNTTSNHRIGISNNGCTSIQTYFGQGNITNPATAANYTNDYGAIQSNTASPLQPANVPYVMPGGDTLCGVTAGTTINVAFGVILSQPSPVPSINP